MRLILVPRLTAGLRLLLVLAVALVSVQTALGRAEARGAESILICAAGGTQVLILDAEGKPVGHRHACPDCVLGGLALDSALPPAAAAPHRLAARLSRPARAPQARRRHPLRLRARGPPGPG
jgi:hypothetical protein